ncbi:hypothetical protein, partial [Thermomicrobium sp.]|uniref:hypothetical protein n=1 Tax=Thermomicrobium sp. TaxID=1969469 RepID=UPI001B184DD3
HSSLAPLIAERNPSRAWHHVFPLATHHPAVFDPVPRVPPYRPIRGADGTMRPRIAPGGTVKMLSHLLLAAEKDRHSCASGVSPPYR